MNCSFPIRLIGSALALIPLLAGCDKKAENHPSADRVLPSASVRVQAIQSKTFTSTEEVMGTIRAKVHASLEAKLSGRIDKLPVLLGQSVKAGELIARLDAPEIKARLEQAQASLQQAERDFKRASALVDQQALTRSEFDTADSRYRMAKAAVDEAQAMMGYVEVLAPFDGVVTRKWVDVGDQASPGKPLVDIEDPARLQLEADVPEAIAAKVKPNDRMTIRVGRDAEELSGTVVEIAPIADPVSRTFRMKLDLPSAPAESGAQRSLMSGQFARLLVPVGQRSSLRVPASAVVHRGQLDIVFVVADQRAQMHLVKPGREINQETEILSGLDQGDSVVVEGAQQLLDGQTVTLK
jgi:RND family efflux transporter MFP subunit